MQSGRNTVFISYSHKDSEYLQELQLHLKPLERYADLYWWADTRLDAGTKWRDEIRDAIEGAKAAILLISQHFLALEFIAEDELPPLLEAAENNNTLILPVILRPSLFSKIEELSRYQAINPPSEPLADLNESQRNKVWVALAEKIVDTLLGGKISLKKDKPGPSREFMRRSRSETDERSSLAELDIIVGIESTNGLTALTFNVTAADSTLGIRYKLFGPVVLRSDLEKLLQPFSRDFASLSLSGGHGVEALISQRRIEGMGAHLLAELLPEDLIILLSNLQGRVRDIAIISDETSIPWELMVVPVQGAETAPGVFLGEAFSVTRFPRGISQTVNFKFKNLAVVYLLEDQAKLSGVEGEVKFLLSLASPNRQVTCIPARYLDILKAFSSGDFDSWHIIGHSRFNADPSRSGIFLEDGESLTPVDLFGSARRLGISRPLIFLSGPTVRGWASTFLRSGAGAVIGPYWETTDNLMEAFTREFYSRIVSGVPFGRAVKESRLELKRAKQDDSSWISLTAFSHPEAAVVDS